VTAVPPTVGAERGSAVDVSVKLEDVSLGIVYSVMGKSEFEVIERVEGCLKIVA
jgi:hypothetical protein